MKLPTRKELPDYYEVIRRPVDISKIQAKIDDGKVKIYIKLLYTFCSLKLKKTLAINHLRFLYQISYVVV